MVAEEIPEDTKRALQSASGAEASDVERKKLTIMLKSANAAEDTGGLVCSDVGIPTYSVKIGTRVQLDRSVRRPSPAASPIWQSASTP